MNAPGPRARARKITPEAVEELCNLVAGGMPVDHACAKLGFRSQSLDEARSRDPELNARVLEARQRGAEWYREQVMHAEDDWKRWAWLAERLHPRVYGPPTQRQEITGRDGAAQQIEHAIAPKTLEELERFEMIARRRDSK